MTKIVFLILTMLLGATDWEMASQEPNYKLYYSEGLKTSKWLGHPDSDYSWDGERLVYERIVKDENGKDVTVKTYKDPIEIIADFKPASKVYGVEGNIEKIAVKKFGGALKGFVWLDKVSGGGEVILPFTAPHIFIAIGDRLNPELTEIGTDSNVDNWYEVIEGKTRVVVKSFSGIGGAAGKPPELIAHYKFNENTAGDNAELVTNGDFSAWTNDNPDGWGLDNETSPSSHTIDGVDISAETFTISDEGDLSTWFKNGNIFEVTGSTGNNGQWKVSSTSWSSPNFVITVTGNITNATADGTITPHPDPDISQVGTGEGHGGAGTGMCNLYSSTGLTATIRQILTLIVGRKYRVSINIDTITLDGFRVVLYRPDWSTVVSQTYTTTGIKTFTFITTTVENKLYLQQYTASPFDVTFDDVSLKLCAVEDSSGNDHDGLAQRQTSDLNVAGKINGAFDFNGSSDYIEIADHDDFDVSTLSISIWIFPDNFGAVRYLIAKLEDTDSEVSYGINVGTDSDVRFILSTDGTVFLTKSFSAGLITAGVWNHIVVTYKEGVGVKFYVNSVFDKLDATETGALYIGTGRLTIGARYDSSEGIARFFFDGLIDNVTFFNLELTLADVKYLYNNGDGREDWDPREPFLGRLNRPLDYQFRRGRYTF